MPIMTEPESNPRWGFLHGLGAAEGEAPASTLPMKAAEQLALINEMQGQITAQIAVIDSEAARLRQAPITKSGAIGADMLEKAKAFKAAVSQVTSLIEDNISMRGLASGALRREIDSKVAEARQKAAAYIEIATEFKKTGRIGVVAASGGSIRVTYTGSQVMGNVIQTYSDMARDLDLLLVNQSYSVSGGAIWNLLPSLLTEELILPLSAIVKKILGVAISILNSAADMLRLMGRAIAKLPEAGNWLLDNWPIVAGVAAVILFGPALWRIYKAGKTGGYMAAGDEVSASLVSTRQSIAAGARSAAGAARKAAAAYASGGTSLAFQGNRSRRYRRRG